MLAQDVAIVYQRGSPLLEEIAEQTKALTASKVFIPVDNDKKEESKTALAACKEKLVCAVGPNAAEAAFGAGASRGVLAGIPNPFSKNYSARSDFACVTLYPDPQMIFEYLSKTLGTKSVGLKYTKRVNQEMADVFCAKAQSAGCACKQLGIGSSTDLTDMFPEFVKQVDVSLLLIDPIAYSKDDIKYLVSKSIEAGKPVIGFSEKIASVGVPMALFVRPADVSQSVALALKEKADKTIKTQTQIYFPANFSLSVNIESARVFGIKYDEAKVVQKF